jgi:prophage regulatory protein
MADRIMRRPEVLELTGLSETTLWRREREGTFPARRRIGPHAVGWLSTEILSWISNLPAAADDDSTGDDGAAA